VHRPTRWTIRNLVLAAACVLALAGCDAVFFGVGSDVLVIRNRSAETVYVRIDAGPQTTIYRIRAGESGLAKSPDAAAPETLLKVFSATCDLVFETSDPPLGEMILDPGGMSFSPGRPADAGTLPILTPDDTCL
jgi:hypothetical protein